MYMDTHTSTKISIFPWVCARVRGCKRACTAASERACTGLAGRADDGAVGRAARKKAAMLVAQQELQQAPVEPLPARLRHRLPPEDERAARRGAGWRSRARAWPPASERAPRR